jgi:hypothetical protein
MESKYLKHPIEVLSSPILIRLFGVSDVYIVKETVVISFGSVVIRGMNDDKHFLQFRYR